MSAAEFWGLMLPWLLFVIAPLLIGFITVGYRIVKERWPWSNWWSRQHRLKSKLRLVA